MREELLKIINHAGKLLSDDRVEEAISLVQSYFPAPDLRDSELHFNAFRILKAMGLDRLAETELYLAVRDNKDNLRALECLVEIYIDKGELGRAEKLLKKVLENTSHEKEVYLLLTRLYEIQGDDASLERVCEEAYKKTGDSIFKDILNTFREKKEIRSDREVLVPSEVHLAKYLTLFRGRDGIHARQWVSPRGEVGFTPVREPLTINLVKNHILGNYTLGVYQLREDNTVCFLAFDLDVSKGVLSSYLSSEAVKRKIDELLLSSAKKIMDRLSEIGLKSYLEYSGFKGYHVWVLFRKPLSARSVREFGLALLEIVKPFPPEISVELFPKQSFLKSGGLGNLIKLPLGIHRRTGFRSLFVDMEGSPYEDQLSFLMAMEAVSEEVFKSAYELLNASRMSFKASSIEEETPPQREFVLEEDKEFMIIKSRCPVIAKLYEKCRSGFTLTGPEITVITFTLGNLSNGDKVVNALLTLSGVQNRKAYLKSKLSGYPMSCPKIRSKIPDITAKCCIDCFAGKEIEGYPTPLLHLKPSEREETDELSIIMDYLKAKRRFELARKELEETELSVRSFMDERGLSEISAEGYTLKLEGDKLILQTP